MHAMDVFVVLSVVGTIAGVSFWASRPPAVHDIRGEPDDDDDDDATPPDLPTLGPTASDSSDYGLGSD